MGVELWPSGLPRVLQYLLYCIRLDDEYLIRHPAGTARGSALEIDQSGQPN